MNVIHPLSIKQHISIAIKLGTSSPSLSVTHLAFVLNLMDIRVIETTITANRVTVPKTLKSHVIILIVLGSNAAWHAIQHIPLPAIAVAVQIHNLVVLHFAQIHIV